MDLVNRRPRRRALTSGAAACALAAVLAGCADQANVDVVRNLPNRGERFHQALQRDYADLAAAERAEADWRDAVFFTQRAKRASAGETFDPQAVGERRIPDHALAEISEARRRLMSVLTDAARRSQPNGASLAQTSFECWLQEQEEDVQPDDIAACKRNFDTAMLALGGTELPPQPMAPAPPVPAAAPALPKQFQILFDFASAELTPEARATVAEIGQAYRAYNPATVLVVGHTDSVGASDANIVLSQRRAEAVADALSGAGVDEARMRIEAYGEERPALAVGDNVREQRNRRVDVRFDKANGN